ncbi:hypothetical protein A7K94_0211585 [Modestobacter sp. VKM Ac-2676]|nr:hypothetical protein A7K94_0211585 [Modestobacter sp. VKM Ac-2676]
MTRIRASLVVGAVAVATLLGSSGSPAQAAFTAGAAMSATVGTVTVAAPTSVTVQTSGCNSRWINVTVSWDASSTARVLAYQVIAHRSDGVVQTVAQTDAATTKIQGTVDKFDLQGHTTTLTVTTLTSYGWTSAPTQKAVFPC